MHQHITVGQYIRALRVLAQRYSEKGELPFEIELFIEEEETFLLLFPKEMLMPDD